MSAALAQFDVVGRNETVVTIEPYQDPVRV